MTMVDCVDVPDDPKDKRIRDLEAALRFCQFYMRDVKFPTDHPMALSISKALTAPETLPEFDPAWVCGVCGKRHGPGQCLGAETPVEPGTWQCSCGFVCKSGYGCVSCGGAAPSGGK